MLGSTGIDSVIFVYNALLRTRDFYEKLIYYAMLHTGDSDTSAWYEFCFGMRVPARFLKYLEFKTKLKDIGKRLYKKYNCHLFTFRSTYHLSFILRKFSHPIS